MKKQQAAASTSSASTPGGGASSSSSSASGSKSRTSAGKSKPKEVKDKEPAAAKKKKAAKAGKVKDEDGEGGEDGEREGEDEEDEQYKWWENMDDDGEIKWHTLEHNGVLFPPAYIPHNVQFVYDGKVLPLPPAAEEVATFYAALADTDWGRNPVFQKNFFRDFQAVLKDCEKAGHPVRRGTSVDSANSGNTRDGRAPWARAAAVRHGRREARAAGGTGGGRDKGRRACGRRSLTVPNPLSDNFPLLRSLFQRLDVKDFAKCDFSHIGQYLTTLKERKLSRTKEEKLVEKEEKKKIDDKYGWALLDGRKEKVPCAHEPSGLSNEDRGG